MKLIKKIKSAINRSRPIAQPKGFALGGSNPGGKITRQMKRHATIEVNGRREKVLEYLKRKAKELPAMLVADTDQKVDHYQNMKFMYYHEGIDGVNRYLETVRKAIRKSVKESKNMKPCTTQQ